MSFDLARAADRAYRDGIASAVNDEPSGIDSYQTKEERVAYAEGRERVLKSSRVREQLRERNAAPGAER